MQIFRGLDLDGHKIDEERPEGTRTGRIVYTGLNGDGSFGIGWVDPHGTRTTLFDPRSWEAARDGSVIVLRRLGADLQDYDVPPWNVNEYRIFLTQ
ncbi:MAG: hypothetical protein Q8P82_02165 [bacterium]|nr:hypothetical protein [bacterium]